jgi:hypothetical protein
MTAVQGGNFWNGFAAGAISSLAASAWQGGTTTTKYCDGVNGTVSHQGVGGFLGMSGSGGMIAFGTIAGGAGASLTGGNFWQGAVTGLIVAGLNHAVHMINKPKTLVVGIYGAGDEDVSGNPDLKKLVEKLGGEAMFQSNFGENDDEIIAYLKSGHNLGYDLEIYAHSRGATATVRIANKLGAMNIMISKITLYDPVGFYGGGNLNFEYPNVMQVTNYYQRNPVDGVAFWANNPFKGSPVSGSFQFPSINNVNLTGRYYNGALINHLNITEYAIKHP